jgi:hypothetical protein
LTFDLYLNGALLAQDLAPATVADLAKLDLGELKWAVTDRGCCEVVDDSGRALAVVAHGDALPQESL